MCLAIYKAKGLSVKTKHLRNAYESNPHGCGIAFPSKHGVTVLKGMWTFEEFLSHYKKHCKKALLIHFRWATHADKNDLNCHPWSMLDGQLAMVHNGILSIECSDKKLSDTGNFIRLVMEPMLRHVPKDSPALQFLVQETIGPGNKFAVMDSQGCVALFNEAQGEWNKGVWYSNDGYREDWVTRYTGFGSGRLRKGGKNDWWVNEETEAVKEPGLPADDSLGDYEWQELEYDVNTAMIELGMTEKEAWAYVRKEWRLKG